jgi:hypothetical protein
VCFGFCWRPLVVGCHVPLLSWQVTPLLHTVASRLHANPAKRRRRSPSRTHAPGFCRRSPHGRTPRPTVILAGSPLLRTVTSWPAPLPHTVTSWHQQLGVSKEAATQPRPHQALAKCTTWPLTLCPGRRAAALTTVSHTARPPFSGAVAIAGGLCSPPGGLALCSLPPGAGLGPRAAAAATVGRPHSSDPRRRAASRSSATANPAAPTERFTCSLHGRPRRAWPGRRLAGCDLHAHLNDPSDVYAAPPAYRSPRDSLQRPTAPAAPPVLSPPWAAGLLPGRRPASNRRC